MINKELFVKSMNTLKEMSKQETELLSTFNINPEWICGEWVWNYYTLLKDSVLGEYEDIGDDFSYFVFELDFGSKWKEGMITDKDGNDIKMQTAEDLYDILISTIEKQKNENNTTKSNQNIESTIKLSNIPFESIFDTLKTEGGSKNEC